MTRRALLAWSASLLALVTPLATPRAARAEEAELCRFRFTNSVNGPIEISTSGGVNWETLGKVVRPASSVGMSTDIVTSVPQGSVAGVAPEHVLVRLPAPKGTNRTLKILAGGEAASSAALSTDLPVKSGLFRCIAPPLGSPVFLEKDGKPAPIAPNYLPKAGDRLLIVVPKPADVEPPTVTIENKVGGEVVYLTTGGVPRVLAKVKQPLKGIGRYAGTERQGAGSVISWSPTAVLVSTSGRNRHLDENGQPTEEKGGFVIQPAEPTLRGVTHPASQILIEALPEGDTKPFLSPFFGLPAPITSGDPLDPKPTQVEMRVDGGDWEPLPDLRGTVNEENAVQALQVALGGKRTVKTGITHLRIRFGGVTNAGFQRRVRLAVTPTADAVQRGVAKINANVMGDGVTYVQFLLDGNLARVSNIQPYLWEWDTTKSLNGEHLIEIRGLDKNLQTVTSVTVKVLVDN